MKIRKKLQIARKNINLTQKKISQKLNLSTNHYQAIELGSRGTTTENWLKLYNLFNKKVPLEELMENTKTVLSLQEEQLNENNFKYNIIKK